MQFCARHYSSRFCHNFKRPYISKLIPVRRIATAAQIPGTIDLSYILHDPAEPVQGKDTKRPLVILHGFLGSKRNWYSVGKALSKELGRPVYALDLRNHGSSPHARPMTYTVMADDVVNFCQNHSLKNITLLGHSMGGKVAMSFALMSNLPKDLLSELIVVDIAPERKSLSPEFAGYIEAMKFIEKSAVTTRQQAQKLLMPYEKDPMTRAFLLMNLESGPSPESPMKFRIPLDILEEALPEIGDFPYAPGQRQWDGPVMFIKGKQSKYITKTNYAEAAEFFPRRVIDIIGASHWVHAQRPEAFTTSVVQFIYMCTGRVNLI